MPYIQAKTTEASGWLQYHVNVVHDIIAAGPAEDLWVNTVLFFTPVPTFPQFCKNPGQPL